MSKLRMLIVRLVKGFVIGAAMLLPGVSGGTMAIILGIYDELISAVSNIKKHFKKNGILLAQYGVAGLAGVLLLSGPLLKLYTAWTNPMLFFFMGAIIGSIPALYKKVRVSRIKTSNIIVAMFGAAVAVATGYLPEGLFVPSSEASFANFALLLAAGVIIAVALVLPGISGSYILLMLGMYHMTLEALKDFNIPYLAPLAVGVLLGIFMTARILEREMEKHPQFTYMLIIGFMLGSVVQIFPGVALGSELIVCALTFVVGVVVIYWLCKTARG